MRRQCWKVVGGLVLLGAMGCQPDVSETPSSSTSTPASVTASAELSPTETTDAATSLLVGRVVPQTDQLVIMPLEGKLATENGCVVLRSDEQGTTTPIAWPSGTAMPVDDPGAIELANGTVRIGEDIGSATGWLIPLVELPDEITGQDACKGDWEEAIVITSLRGIAMQD